MAGKEEELPAVPVAVAVTDVSFMNESLWLGWRRWTWVRIAFAFVVLMSVFALYRTDQGNKERTDQFAQAAIDDNFKQCESSNDARTILRNIIILSGESQTFDLTRVPGFSDLDAPTQKFFENLRDASKNQPDAADDPDSFQSKAMKKLVLRDCEKEFPTHS